MCCGLLVVPRFWGQDPVPPQTEARDALYNAARRLTVTFGTNLLTYFPGEEIRLRVAAKNATNEAINAASPFHPDVASSDVVLRLPAGGLKRLAPGGSPGAADESWMPPTMNFAAGQTEIRTYDAFTANNPNQLNLITPSSPGDYQMSYSFADSPAPGLDFRVIASPIYEAGSSVRVLPDVMSEPEGDTPSQPFPRYRTFVAVRSQATSYICAKLHEEHGSTMLQWPSLRVGFPTGTLNVRRVARSTQPITSMSATVDATGIYTVTYRTATGTESTVRVGADLFPIDGAPMYDDVTLRTQPILGGFRRLQPSGLYAQVVTLQNIGTTPIDGPIHMVVDALPAGVEVANPAGLFQGKAYVTFPVISLAPNAQTQLTILFMNPSNAVISFTRQILSGPIF
jgi:hypothetical protein